MLSATNLSFSFGANAILRDVNIEIPQGGLVGILGPNGSGKTTLLRLLAGTLKPKAGAIRLGSEDLGRISRGRLARRLAVVPQETHLAFDYTVLEIVLMGRYPHLGPFEVEGAHDITSATAALEATGTAHLIDRAFESLSGGEKQRVVIASALAQLDEGLTNASPERRLLLLDEPTASLDLRYQIEVGSLLTRLHDRQDITILLSTHDLHFAASVCREIVMLRDGRVLAQGSPADVLQPETIAALYDIHVDQVPAFATAGR